MDENLLKELMEPITADNIHELKPGEWIWDNQDIERREHRKTLDPKTVVEKVGFRQIHILDLDLYPRFSSHPFMLSDIYASGYAWEYFEHGRYWKFKDRSQLISPGYEPKVIAVDFDGTLCEDAYPGIGAPREDVITYLKGRKMMGDKIILWTCRVDEKLDEAVDWCLDQGLIFDAVNDNLPELVAKYGGNPRKVFADEYIDDRMNQGFEFK